MAGMLAKESPPGKPFTRLIRPKKVGGATRDGSLVDNKCRGRDIYCPRLMPASPKSLPGSMPPLTKQKGFSRRSSPLASGDGGAP
jgi:hypothetical protein